MPGSQQLEVHHFVQNASMLAAEERDARLFYPIGRRGTLFLITVLLFMLSSSFPLTAGGKKKGAEEREIQFWHSFGTHNKAVLSSLVDGYNQNGRQRKIHSVFQGSEGDLYLKLLAQENLPEIVLLPIQYLQVLRDRAIITDISPHISNRIKDDIDEKYWVSLTIDEGIYGIPFSFHSSILYVNRHVLRISGTRRDREADTWDELIPILQKIRDNTDGKWGIYVPMENLNHFITYVESFSGVKVVEEQRLTVNSPRAAEAMKTLQDLVFRYQVMPPQLTSSEADQLFFSGNLGIRMAESSHLVYTQTNLPFNLTVWSLPSSADTPPHVTGSCLAVTSRGLNRIREIFRFVDYLIDYENSIKWHTHTGSPAMLESARDSIDLLIFYEENPNYMTSITELQRGAVFSPRYDYYSIDDVMRLALDRIMINGEDPRPILDDLQRELDLMIIPSM
jgi:ABC-type glycerol-3-phosphate transport system substrate-binding protein